MQSVYNELKKSYTFKDLQDSYQIEDSIADLLKVKRGNQKLTCEVRKEILFYLVGKSPQKRSSKSTDIKEICSILEGKHNIDCKSDESLKRSTANVIGLMVKGLVFLSGNSWTGYYLLPKCEAAREELREYIDNYKCP